MYTTENEAIKKSKANYEKVLAETIRQPQNGTLKAGRAASELSKAKRELYHAIENDIKRAISNFNHSKKINESEINRTNKETHLKDVIARDLTFLLQNSIIGDVTCQNKLKSGFVIKFPWLKSSVGKPIELVGKLPLKVIFDERAPDRLKKLKLHVHAMMLSHDKNYNGPPFEGSEDEIFNDTMIALEITINQIKGFDHSTDPKIIEEAQLNLRDIMNGFLFNLNQKVDNIIAQNADTKSYTELLNRSKEIRDQAQGIIDVMCGISIGIGSATLIGCLVAAMFVPGVNIAILGIAGIAGCTLAGTGSLSAIGSNIQNVLYSFITDKKIENYEFKMQYQHTIEKAEKLNIKDDILSPLSLLADASIDAEFKLYQSNQLHSDNQTRGRT